MIFSSGHLAGHYKPEYENYGSLFRQVGELSHNSCFVLNSWDKPREIAKLEGENAPVRSVQLDGLGREAIEIFKEKRLVEEEDWKSLVNLYRGNPLGLKIIAILIKDLFGGRSSDYLKYDTLVLGDELKTLLTQQFQRLSELEKQVMSYISSKVEPVSTAELLENTQLSPSELFSALQSLGWRSLMEKQEQNNQIVFTLAPVVKQYVKTQYPPTEK